MKTKEMKLIIFSSVLLAFYILAQRVLRIYDLQFRAWINVSCLLLVCVGYVTAIIRWLIRTRSKKALWILIALVVCAVPTLFTPLGWYVIFFLEGIPHKEYVYQVDGCTFVGYESDYLDTFIDFYDYKNAFVSGTEKRFTACGHDTDDDGNFYFYDDFHRFEHLEDIYRYN